MMMSDIDLEPFFEPVRTWPFCPTVKVLGDKITTRVIISRCENRSDLPESPCSTRRLRREVLIAWNTYLRLIPTTPSVPVRIATRSGAAPFRFRMTFPPRAPKPTPSLRPRRSHPHSAIGFLRSVSFACMITRYFRVRRRFSALKLVPFFQKSRSSWLFSPSRGAPRLDSPRVRELARCAGIRTLSAVR